MSASSTGTAPSRVKRILRLLGLTAAGLAVVGEYQVDGASSTGVFAGASGSGSDTSQVAPPPSGLITATISGKLHLAQSGD